MNELFYRGEAFNANFYYYAQTDIDHAFLLRSGKRRTLWVPKMNEQLARRVFRGTVRVYQRPWEEWKKRIRGKRIGIDGHALPWAMARKLAAISQPVDRSEKFLQERMKKAKHEIVAVAKATRVTREILEDVDIREGMREEEIKKQLLRATIEQGAEAAFEPIVATAENARFPHYRAGQARLRDMVLMDYGVRYRQYCSDVTRCFFLRKNIPMHDAYERCQRVSDDLLDELPALHTGGDVADAAAALMKQHRLPPLIHSIGHGVGLEVHEWPRLHAKSKDKIAGSVLAIEPGAYFSRFGVRYENTVYFDGRKARVLG